MKNISWHFALGSVLLLGALIWWAVVFYFVSQQTGESMSSFVSCTVIAGEHCNFYRAMAWLQGINPYEPGMLWAGLALLLAANRKPV